MKGLESSQRKKQHLYVKIVGIIPLNIWGVVLTVGLGLLLLRKLRLQRSRMRVCP